MDQLNNILSLIKNKSLEFFNDLKYKTKSKNTKTYLEYRINKFFKKEKNFKKHWLDLYYNFNKEISKIIATPFYVTLFYSNFNYITTSVINSEWDEIMEIYKKVLEKNPNYKNSRLDDPKPIYDRRYILIITYTIFTIFLYIFADLLYGKMSELFNKIILNLNIQKDYNATFVVLVAYIFFILGLYYGGIDFIYKTVLLIIKLLYYIIIVIYYLLYYIIWFLFIVIKLFGRLAYKNTSAMTGGKKK